MKSTLTILLLILSLNVFSQTDTIKPKKIEKWGLGTTFGYTTVVEPFTRNNFQLTLNLRYRTGPFVIGFQPGINYTYETKTPDIRVGIRLQYEFLRW